MIAVMAKDDGRENMRTRLRSDLKREWDALLDSKRITQQDAIESMIQFVLGSEPLVQSMFFQQIPPTPELIELANVKYFCFSY